jgi:DNA-binding PadR family transcriptional regulator
LASLANGPKDAAAMIEDIATLCGMRLEAKTIYNAINQLQQRRWIEPHSSAKVEHRYRLTIAGLHAFRASLAALRRCSHTTLQKLEAI